MKRLSIVLTAILTLFVFSSQSMAQNVPVKVKQAFSKKFPDAKSVNWGKESDTEYEAEFMFNGTPHSANFDANGNWKETEMKILENELPNLVRQTLARDYRDAVINEAAKITTPGETLYEVEISKKRMVKDESEETEHHEKKESMEKEEHENEMATDLIFNASGKVVKKKSFEKEKND